MANNKKKTEVLAIDFGASSGRAIVGSFDGTKIALKEIHRFTNDPVIVGKTMYWDVLRLFHEIKNSLIKAKQESKVQSLGIDTWGVDFGLLDAQGRLLNNPVHYRDQRTQGMLEKAFSKLDKDKFYQLTGNQFMELNTVFQLLAMQEQDADTLERAKGLLFMPDLFNYFLSGEKAAEYTIASTSQMLDAKNKTWSNEVIEALQLPKDIFADIVEPGTKVGCLTDSICEELGLDKLDVVAVAGHDTQSAMIAVPTQEDDFVFLSCGTWSLLGTELDAPIIDKNSSELNITNEGAANGKISFLKNIIGLWLIQESRRQWIKEGKEFSFGELESMAKERGFVNSFIDTDDSRFVSAGNIPQRIKDYCQSTNQHVPENEAEIVRCIDQSLALKYRYALEQIEMCTGKTYNAIHMVGGGIQSRLLCQLTADVCGKKVVAGPVEATVMGNIAMQLIALGEVKDLKEARQVIADSEELAVYEPQEHEKWNDIYAKLKEAKILC